ncbi:hypothetical protein NQ318_003709 [Aromia moschata]|uniref:Uncharacterized protein n=1 Tax=Aromia moschata TaxID=1265417 RepID=A0AAV8YGQ0_9CUCU|nr:hypothetical protein NQ318_003709 [Aromia moschata]
MIVGRVEEETRETEGGCDAPHRTMAGVKANSPVVAPPTLVSSLAHVGREASALNQFSRIDNRA